MLVTLGLSPALQRVMVFDHYHPNEVNRATETHTCAAGKAINAARAARRFAPELAIMALGPQGGPSGNVCRQDLVALNVTDQCVEITRDTRTCVTVIDRAARTVTELVEEPPYLAPNDRHGILNRAAPCQVLLCAGTLPPGTHPANTPPDFFAQAAARCLPQTLIIDAKGPPLLSALAAPTTARRIAKLNAEEALATTAAPDLTAAIAALHAAGATHIVITDGPRAVHASTLHQHHTFAPPKVQIQNTTGCGDTLAGVLAAALALGTPFEQAVAQGIAASAASAETLLPAYYDPARARALRAAL